MLGTAGDLEYEDMAMRALKPRRALAAGIRTARRRPHRPANGKPMLCGSPTSPAPDDVLTIAPAPCRSICMTSYLRQSQTPLRFISMTRSQSSSGYSCGALSESGVCHHLDGMRPISRGIRKIEHDLACLSRIGSKVESGESILQPELVSDHRVEGRV